jgi:hypothetical protein
MPSAPSPQFPGLAASPLQHNTEEGFSFMHESEVDRCTVVIDVAMYMYVDPLV